jgi:hypothetical protein
VAPIEKHNRSWLLAQVMPLDSNGIAGGANARLIASAPELLEALLMVRDADNDCLTDGLPTIPSMARAKIDAAIKKAEGA